MCFSCLDTQGLLFGNTVQFFTGITLSTQKETELVTTSVSSSRLLQEFRKTSQSVKSKHPCSLAMRSSFQTLTCLSTHFACFQIYQVSRNVRESLEMVHDLQASRKCYKISRNLGYLIDILFFCKKACFWCESERILV